MKESYEEELAIHFGLNPYAESGDRLGVASVGGPGRLSDRAPKSSLPCADLVLSRGRQHAASRQWRVMVRHGGVVELSMPENFKRENREILLVSKPNFSDVETVWIGQKTLQVVTLT